MPGSILDETKKVLGIEPEATAFDTDLIMHINTVFFSLQQLGVGSDEGYMITDKTATWTDYLGDNKNLNAVKSYMYLRIRLLFDPPATSFALDAIQKQITELEWRLNVESEKGKIVKELEEAMLVYEIDETQGFPGNVRVGEVGFDPETGNVWRQT
jgi:hypothetical protein